MICSEAPPRRGARRLPWLALFGLVALSAACETTPVAGVSPDATTADVPGDVAKDLAAPDAQPCAAGEARCGGRCVNTASDTANCGACGNACPSGQVCAAGRCDVTCGTLTACGGDDGGAPRACADLRVDPRNCGACGMACALPNVAVNACVAGACVAAGCAAGFADCDGMPVNGCETSVRGDDANNCGGCGVACRFSNAAGTCAMGACALGACAAGFADCDMNPMNGCEASTNTDNANCGMCGRTCPSGQVCAMGACASSCGTTATNCSGDCVNTNTDPAHCGGCGAACRLANVSVNACAGGACVVGGCNAGFADCDGMAANGCETNVRGADANNCGGCGVACRFSNAAGTCGAGTCALGACAAGFADCDMNPMNGCEASTNTDNANCGMCGRACPSGQVCSMGSCVSTCGAGTTACSGDCVNTRTDPANCGGCGAVCSLRNVSVNACASGACVVGGCNAGFADCDGTAANGCETNVRGADASNCGGCGIVCRFANATATCGSGTCALGACASGFADCDESLADGCEANLATDGANCGMCGRACAAGQVCVAGTCTVTCGPGTTNCSGTCANLATDPAHCGACTNTCGLPNVAVNTCDGGACGIGSCGAGFADCDENISNGCETNTATSNSSCGGCGRACATGQTCVSGSCTTTTATGTVFQVAGLSASTCALVEHNTVTGDDRGGIAVSAGQVFYTGDNATGRFATGTLSGGAPTAAASDALFSDLSTQQVYSFGTAAGPFRGTFAGASVTLDRIFPLDGDSGAAGSATMLSAPIVISDTIFTAAQGYFSGAGRAIVVANGHAYDVALPAGTVRDLGAFTFPGHQVCESSAVWGVAEFFGGALYIDYVQTSTTIARTQVFPPGGATTTLATFTSLSDMCSFTVSPTTNRWFWHHEGGSQFGGSDESIGYCSMVPNYVFSPGSASFIDACAAAGHTTVLANVDDAVGSPVNIGFTFNFYGTPYTQVRPSSNGYMLFGASTVTGSPDGNYYPTMPLPDMNRPFPAIFVYNSDIYTRSTGVCLATVGSAPSRRFVYEGADEGYCCSVTGNFTFEAILNESDGSMDFVYQNIGYPAGDGHNNIVGVQNSGTLGVTYEYVDAGRLTRVVTGTSLHVAPP